MTKRLLLIGIGVVVLLVVVVVVLAFLSGRRRPPPETSPTPEGSPPPTDLTLPSEEPLLTLPPTTIPSTPTTRPLTAALCPAGWGEQSDTDGDRLPDLVEGTYRTDPTIADTDQDGFSDGDEVENGYDPLRAGTGGPRLDSDGDGLLEHDECSWKTDPLTPDTDGDGFTDGDEVTNGFDPTRTGDGKGSDRLPPTPSPLGTIFPALPDVQRSELTILPTSTPVDIRAYLTATENASAKYFTESSITTMSEGITAVREQQRVTPELQNARRNFQALEKDLLKIPTPEAAVEHHRLYIAIMRFVSDRLRIIEENAATDTVKVQAAMNDIFIVLNRDTATLLAELSQLDALAQGP